MLNNITFGQYFPYGSYIHKMNPAIKMLLCIALIVMIFMANNAVSIGISLVVTLVLMFITRIPVKMYLRSIKPIIFVVVLTAILNALYVNSGPTLVNWWIIHITTGGVLHAVYMALRITMLLVLSSMLTYTTSPTDISTAVELLLSPLKVIRIDVQSLSMMMTIALRFIPILLEETDKIMNAQKSRGADMESGGLKQRAKALLPIFIPLLVSSFRRAGDLADAMECRCYTGGNNRTKMKKNIVAARDIVASVFVVVIFVIIVLADTNLDGFLLSLFK